MSETVKNEVIKNRIDFVYFIDVKNGNPNGDPDAGNMPRRALKKSPFLRTKTEKGYDL